MNIIVHYPTTSEKIEELKKRVTTMHIEAITAQLNSLSCPKSQKLLLMDEIRNSNQERKTG